MVLSIIVISHNQREILKRCINSILAQNIPFEHEIIISDDASEDGTWELAQEFETNYPMISAYQCNTNCFNPITSSDRAGWNRCNGYQHATGRYLAHIDGDDFLLLDSHIYEKQVELLEKNPDCSCCMANDYQLTDGEDIGKVRLLHNERFSTGDILASETYIKNFFRESHCFVFRRNCNVDPIQIYGGYYDDSMITDHHLQYGDIVCLDDAGYVYVKYQSSLWQDNVKSNDHIVFAHALYIPLLIPKWIDAFYRSTYHHIQIYKVVRLALSRHQLKESNIRWINQFDVYLYHVFNRKLSIIDWLHLTFLLVYLKFLIKFRLNSRALAKILKILI